MALKTVNLPTTPAAAVAALSNKVRLALLALAAVALPACSSSSDATPVTTSGMVQNLTLDPAGQTIVTTLEGFEGTISPAAVEASGGQSAVTVTVTGSTFSIAFDSVVSPDHQVRFVGVAGISEEWRDVTSTDSRNPSFSILGATQDVSDSTLGGDTISVQFFSGPRVLESAAEDISNHPRPRGLDDHAGQRHPDRELHARSVRQPPFLLHAELRRRDRRRDFRGEQRADGSCNGRFRSPHGGLGDPGSRWETSSAASWSSTSTSRSARSLAPSRPTSRWWITPTP
ncbi:hypothetical protein N9L45_00930, partial [Planctomycetota bacterium]|nr:hypothetical protein [Planctomycetota bacterium]